MSIKQTLFVKTGHVFRALTALILAVAILGSTNSLAASMIATDPFTAINLIESNNQAIIIDFHSPKYELVKADLQGRVYQSFRIPGSAIYNEPGHPQLPIFSTLVGIPAGAQFNLRIISDQTSVLPAAMQLLPSETIQPIQEDLTPGSFGFTQDHTALLESLDKLSDGLYPKMPAFLTGEAWLRNQRIIRIVFYPFQYDPAHANVIWHHSLRAQIDFKFSSRIGAYPAQTLTNPFDAVLKDNLINYSESIQWRSSDGPVQKPAGSMISPSSSSSTQPQYRISIEQDGIYRLTYENLKLAGVPVDYLNIANTQMTNQGRSVAFYFEDNNDDQVFDAGDSLLFYGQKFYGDWMAQRYANENANWLTFSTQLTDGSYSTWKPSMNATMLEKYTDENVYWLIPGIPGMQMKNVTGSVKSLSNSKPSELNTSPTNYLPFIMRHSDLTSYRETVHAEQSHRWKTTLFTGEDTWFWDEIQTSSTETRSYPITISLPIQNNAQAKLSGELVAATYNNDMAPDHHVLIFLNDPGHVQPVLDATWDGKSRFHFDVDVLQSKLVDGQNNIDLVVQKTPSLALEDIFVDWFQIEFDRPYVAQNNQLTFRNEQIGAQSYRITGLSSTEASVFEISNPIQPVRIGNYTYSGGTIRFTANQTASSRYVVGAAVAIPPGDITTFTPIDYSQPADYIFITHRNFRQALQPLVDYRAGEGFKTLVVNVDDLYNQFNDGIYNPIAIKNFLAYTFQNWATSPSYVLLVGDGHWNFKGYPDYDSPPIYMPPFLNWVDPWQGEVDSANLLGTVVGDDPLADVMIGRMPVNSDQELSNIISKTMAYEQNPAGAWKKHVLFVADNTPDPAGDFVVQSNQIISTYIPASYTSDKVYLDDFMDNNNCTPPALDGVHQCPAATKALIDDLNNTGAFFVNYTGHASINFWASEDLFVNQDIGNLTNNGKLPIVISMTCLDGYWIHPNLASASKAGPSLAEEILRAQQKGAVATFSPTGLGVGTGHDALSHGFYSAVFQSRVTRFGEATTSAKLNLYSTGSNLDLLQTFIIFGDPALIFNTP